MSPERMATDTALWQPAWGAPCSQQHPHRARLDRLDGRLRSRLALTVRWVVGVGGGCLEDGREELDREADEIEAELSKGSQQTASRLFDYVGRQEVNYGLSMGSEKILVWSAYIIRV